MTSHRRADSATGFRLMEHVNRRRTFLGKVESQTYAHRLVEADSLLATYNSDS